jgi:hypothetical protein
LECSASFLRAVGLDPEARSFHSGRAGLGDPSGSARTNPAANLQAVRGRLYLTRIFVAYDPEEEILGFGRLRTPTVFHPPAQGCAAGATLGHPSRCIQPQRALRPRSVFHSTLGGTTLRFRDAYRIPRVGLIPFGQPWAGGRKPVGLGTASADLVSRMKLEIRARNVEPMAIFMLKDTREVQAGMHRTKALRAKKRNPTTFHHTAFFPGRPLFLTSGPFFRILNLA